MRNSEHFAYVIRIEDRYFYRFGKGGRVLTAWCLAGADLFHAADLEKMHKVKEKLKKRGKGYFVIPVGELS